MTKLVIGANGFLGSHVTRQLVDAGYNGRKAGRGGQRQDPGNHFQPEVICGHEGHGPVGYVSL